MDSVALDCISWITYFLNPIEIAKFSRVGKRYREVCNRLPLWKFLFEKYLLLKVTGQDFTLKGYKSHVIKRYSILLMMKDMLEGPTKPPGNFIRNILPCLSFGRLFAGTMEDTKNHFGFMTGEQLARKFFPFDLRAFESKRDPWEKKGTWNRVMIHCFQSLDIPGFPKVKKDKVKTVCKMKTNHEGVRAKVDKSSKLEYLEVVQPVDVVKMVYQFIKQHKLIKIQVDDYWEEKGLYEPYVDHETYYKQKQQNRLERKAEGEERIKKKRESQKKLEKETRGNKRVKERSEPVVTNIVTTSHLGFEIDIQSFLKATSLNATQFGYGDNRLVINLGSPKCSNIIFGEGTVITTGCKTMEQINEAWKLLLAEFEKVERFKGLKKNYDEMEE